VEVLIQPAAPASSANTADTTGYFLSVPSPQIAGIPADDAARSYLADYLAVRLIAARAKQISTSPEGYLERTTQAIEALGLANVDPGYLASGQRRDNRRPRGLAPVAPLDAQPQNTALVWHNEEYTVVAGDTLTSIAARFGTPIETIARVNHLAHPDQLAAGARLTIPVIDPKLAAP